MSHREIVQYAGLGITGVLAVAGFLKKLRDDRRIFILVILTFFIAAFGLFIRSPEYQMKGANAADFFICPLIYIGLYSMLRRFYKKKYGMEPTYNRSSWFDPEEGRKQNWLDVAVFVLPMIVSCIIPIVITSIMKSVTNGF